MSTRPSRKAKLPEKHAKVIEEAMNAASEAVKDAEKAYAAAGLDRKAQFSLAGSAMREAGKLAEDAVKIAIAQVAEAMDQIPHQKRSDR